MATFWTVLARALSKVWKYVAVAAAGYEIHATLDHPQQSPIIAIPQPYGPIRNSETNNLNKEDIMALLWAGLGILIAIFLVIGISKCISAIRYKPDE